MSSAGNDEKVADIDLDENHELKGLDPEWHEVEDLEEDGELFFSITDLDLECDGDCAKDSNDLEGDCDLNGV